MDIYWKTLFLLLIQLCGSRGQNHQVTAVCRGTTSSVAGDVFEVEVEIAKLSDTDLTDIFAFDASETPPYTTVASGCSLATPNNGQDYKVGGTVNTLAADPLCGYKKVGDIYSFAISANGTGYVHTFSCDASQLQSPTDVITNSFDTAVPVQVHTHRTRKADVKIDAWSAYGDRVPVDKVRRGEKILLRVTYDKGCKQHGPSNVGKNFHTACLRHCTKECLLRFVTLGMGSVVTVDYSGTSHKIGVKRGDPVTLQVLRNHQNNLRSTSTADSWKTEAIGIVVKTYDDPIGVELVCRTTDNKESSFVVQPDESVGNAYRAVTDTDEVLVLGIANGTSVAVTFNGFTPSNANQFLDKDETTIPFTTSATIPLDENEAISFDCSVGGCSDLTLDSSNDFVVITGDGGKYLPNDTDGAYAIQLTATDYLGTEFVFPDFHVGSPNDDEQRYFAATPVVSGTYNVTKFDGESGPINDIAEIATTGSADSTEARFDAKVSVFQHTTDTDGPSLLWLPPVQQWGISQYFFAEENRSYKVVIVSAVDAIQHIEVTFSGIKTGFVHSSLGDKSGFQTESVTPLGVDQVFEMVTFDGDFDVTEGKSGVIEFRSGDTNTRFMAQIYESGGPYGKNARNAFGLGVPIINFPCVSSSSEVDGNGIDDDCDGMVDEDEDDGDDPALDCRETNTGIYVKKLWVSDQVDFTGPLTYQVIDDGCNTDPDFASIGHFTHNTGLASPEFDNLWVSDSQIFYMFGLSPELTEISFRADIEFCHGNVTSGSLCQDPCRARKRRSETDTESEGQIVDLTLKVERNATDTNINLRTGSKGNQPHACANNVTFWVPAVIALVILLVEAVVTGTLVCKKSYVKSL